MISSEGATPAYRPDIDGLRAIAVLMVVLFGMGLAPGGYVGVDVFFVISGYLITAVILIGLKEGSFSFADFYARRVRRIFPTLILVLFVTAITGWFLLLSDEYRQLGWNTLASALFAPNFAFRNEIGYFDPTAKFNPLLHLWSLGVEAQFYLVWPVSLYLAYKWKIKPSWVIVIVAADSFLLNTLQITDHQGSAFYLPGSRFWELMEGGLLAHWELEGERAPLMPDIAEIRAALGALLLVASLLLLDKNTTFPGWAAMLPVTGAALIIAAGPNTLINRYLLGNPVLVFIGLISYPLYLWHWPLLSYAYILTGGDPNIYVRWMLMALAVLLATLTYAVVERKSREAFSRSAGQVTGILVAAMLLIAAGGETIMTADGFASRFPQLAEYERFGASEPNWQRDTCFLLPTSPISDSNGFDINECADKRAPGKPTILLVGDSHAAALYPGLVATFGDKANIGQLTSDACVPLVENVKPYNPKDSDDRCKELNKYIFAKIRATAPDVLIIAGNYAAYNSSKEWLYPNYLQLMENGASILLSSSLTKHIIIVGQAPEWTIPLPRIAARMMFNSMEVPDRSNFGRDPAAEKADEELGKFHWTAGRLIYLPLLDKLCGEHACLIKTGDKLPDDLISIDTGHLSESGSRYVVETIIGPVIAPMLVVKKPPVTPPLLLPQNGANGVVPLRPQNGAIR